MNKKGYAALAPYYDGFFEPAYRARIERAYRRLLGRYIKKGDSVLDFGCGTGQLSFALAAAGYRVTGADIDEAMLAVARKRAEEEGADIRFLSGLEKGLRVSAVTASLDVVNHITDPAELQKTFFALKNCLVKGGVLIFDINTEKKFRELYGHHSYCYQSPGVFCVWKNDYRPEEGLCRFTVSVYEAKGKGFVRREDRICERCYPDETIVRMLRAAGFRRIRVRSLDQGTRHIFIVR